MFFLGIRLAIAQGLMLLMSYSGTGVSDVMAEIEAEPSITAVEEARFWQVHYGLCMANLKLRVKGSATSVDDGTMGKLREKIGQLVKKQVGWWLRERWWHQMGGYDTVDLGRQFMILCIGMEALAHAFRHSAWNCPAEALYITSR